jgi:transposase
VTRIVDLFVVDHLFLGPRRWALTFPALDDAQTEPFGPWSFRYANGLRVATLGQRQIGPDARARCSAPRRDGLGQDARSALPRHHDHLSDAAKEAGMTWRKRRAFTPDFKAEAVRLAKAGGRSITQVAKDLDLTETALRTWIKHADLDTRTSPPNALTTAEREELERLRREVKRLQMEREILKKAAAFFAKESE